MGYQKITIISGNTDAPHPSVSVDHPDHRAQFDRWYKCFVLNGHWKPASALNFARKHGIVSDVKLAHETFDSNGKGRSSIDLRCTVNESGVIRLPISKEEQEDFAYGMDEAVAELD